MVYVHLPTSPVAQAVATSTYQPVSLPTDYPGPTEIVNDVTISLHPWSMENGPSDTGITYYMAGAEYMSKAAFASGAMTCPVYCVLCCNVSCLSLLSY